MSIGRLAPNHDSSAVSAVARDIRGEFASGLFENCVANRNSRQRLEKVGPQSSVQPLDSLVLQRFLEAVYCSGVGIRDTGYSLNKEYDN